MKNSLCARNQSGEDLVKPRKRCAPFPLLGRSDCETGSSALKTDSLTPDFLASLRRGRGELSFSQRRERRGGERTDDESARIGIADAADAEEGDVLLSAEALRGCRAREQLSKARPRARREGATYL